MRALAILLLAAAALNGDAAEVAVEAGQVRFGVERDGVFWQADQHTDNYLRPAALSLSVTDRWKNSENFGWRVSFLKTGNFAARGNVATPDDDAHNPGTCDPNTGAHCHSSFDATGGIKAVSAGLTGEVPIYGHWSAILEGGLVFFKSSIAVTVTPLDYNAAVRRGEEHTRWTDTPSPLVGLTVRYRSVYFAVRKVWPAEHHALSLTDYSQTQVMLGLVVVKL